MATTIPGWAPVTYQDARPMGGFPKRTKTFLIKCLPWAPGSNVALSSHVASFKCNQSKWGGGDFWKNGDLFSHCLFKKLATSFAKINRRNRPTFLEIFNLLHENEKNSAKGGNGPSSPKVNMPVVTSDMPCIAPAVHNGYQLMNVTHRQALAW